MKKILSIITLAAFASCTKPEAKISMPTTTCDTGGIVGTFYKKRFEGNIDEKWFSVVELKAFGTDSFTMTFPSHPSYQDTAMPLYYSPAKPCRVLEFTNSHISLKDHVVYTYMRSDTLVDSFVVSGKWLASLYFTENKY
jgi:hypothetical protein